jgi:hypothetical protein
MLLDKNTAKRKKKKVVYSLDDFCIIVLILAQMEVKTS